MNLVILVALVNKELFLHPVCELHEFRVKEILDVLNIFLGDTHTAQFHTTVTHLVSHVDVEQVALRQFVVFHLTAVKESYGRFRQFAVDGEEVAPRHVLAINLADFSVKDFQCVTIACVLLFGGGYPVAHITVPQIALAP